VDGFSAKQNHAEWNLEVAYSAGTAALKDCPRLSDGSSSGASAFSV